MAGRHRRSPAWRRLLMRLRRTDRAARTAALQAEVVALRATISALRTELATAQASAAAATAAAASAADAAAVSAADAAAVSVADAAAPPARELRWVSLDLPMVQAPALAARADGAAEVAVASATTIEIDLRDVIARADLVLSALPEAALLDPKRDRDDGEVIDPAGAVIGTESVADLRRTA
ncbi:MAG: hypothetical protein ACXV3C_03560 [Actinomycetes bacterium]